jgi:hypothetical protein
MAIGTFAFFRRSPYRTRTRGFELRNSICRFRARLEPAIEYNRIPQAARSLGVLNRSYLAGENRQ